MPLRFEFWDGENYREYAPREQAELSSRLQEQPRPATVKLHDGLYVVKDFDCVEAGRASQINTSTGTARHVRLQPRCSLPDVAPRPSGFQTKVGQYQLYGSKGWEPYDDELQKEFAAAAARRPAPAVLQFTHMGRQCRLFGLDGETDLEQEDIASQVFRSVRHVASDVGTCALGALPPLVAETRSEYPWTRISSLRSCTGLPDGLLAKATFSLDMRTVPQHWWRRKRGLSTGCFGSAAVAFVPAADPALTSEAAALAAAAAAAGCIPAAGSCEELLSPSDVSTLRRSLVRVATEGLVARPSTLALPSGRVVENLSCLEAQLAGCFIHTKSLFRQRSKASRAPLRMRLPDVEAGRVTLPSELEVEDAGFDVNSCGQLLDKEDLEELVATDSSATQCPICLADVDEAGEGLELHCGHLYHADCIAQWFKSKKRCPQCQRDYGKVIGEQPDCGVMTWSTESECLPGHQDDDTTSGMIVLYFHFPAGVDANGRQYGKRSTRAYLPLNVQGIILLELFKVAFRRRVMYGLGHSLTNGAYRPTFNIHLKTSRRGGTESHGYPDTDYFSRALEELRANGVTLADVF